MDKKKAFEILKNDGHKNIVFIEKEANFASFLLANF